MQFGPTGHERFQHVGDTERVADQVLPRVEGDAAARDVDDARRVRPLLVVVVLASALLECFLLVCHVLVGARSQPESDPLPTPLVTNTNITRSDLLSHPLSALRRSAVARLRKIMSLVR